MNSLVTLFEKKYKSSLGKDIIEGKVDLGFIFFEIEVQAKIDCLDV